MPLTISSCGFIGTGSSAVTDLLKEFSDNDTYDKFEFRFIYSTDGLLDLKYHLFEGNHKYESSTSAIQRFLKLVNSSACKNYNKATNGRFKKYAYEFIDKITQGSWIGCFADPIIEPKRKTFINILNKTKILKLLYSIEYKNKKTFNFYPFKKVVYSINPENFDKCANEFLNRVFEALGLDLSKNIVFNQMFSGNNPQACFSILNSPKAIVVDRDPRDLYLQYKLVNYYTKERQHPVKDVNTFIDLYKRMRKNQPYLNKNENILIINFEDLVYEYEATKKKIMEFCNLKNHAYPKKYFDPDRSIANTQFFKQDTRFKKDIEKIEKELKEYLYDFSKYNIDVTKLPKSFDDNSFNPEGYNWHKQKN